MELSASSPFKPTLLDEVQPHFDVEKKWEGTLNMILSKAQTFNRAQQAQLARLAIRSSEEPEFINELVAQLSHQNFDGLREVTLTRLLAEKEPELYSVILEQCIDLVSLNPENIEAPQWKAVCHLWLETLIKHPDLMKSLKRIELFDSPKKELILNIIAYSSFPSHIYPTVPRTNYFKDGAHPKILKLEEKLATLSNEELTMIAMCYPRKPAPDTRDVLAFIKNSNEVPLDKALSLFLTEEQALFRQDYQQLSSTREFDLERMLKLTYVTRGKENKRISPASGAKLILMLQYLKRLEQGQDLVLQGTKPLSQMTQEELQRAFSDCSEAAQLQPDNGRLQIQIWAILFETLGRSTGKYPHLAQQFALIATQVLLAEDPSSILQLKTGEGKSNFVALRAARHAAKGDKVTVCTAKWSLAERDLLDYQQFFDYLQLTTANIHARSSHDTYAHAQIVYTTPGDLSLFLDEQASQGTAIEINKATNVALGDEFDFLYYEGQKTQFNYARHTGTTPKEMAWFYRGINMFYDNLPAKKTPITPQVVQECFKFLSIQASEEGRIYLESLTPMMLLSWLQSAHEAASLEVGINYTVRLEQVKIGEEEFSLREIYPLTKDMQTAVGSTFSHGVHQLLAERLNFEAQLNGEAQDYHVHPESDIISSQVFSQRLKSCFGHWEGFTGTVSSSQALELNQVHHTAVLRVPTNQKDLRKWPKPEFFTAEDQRLQSMVRDIKKRIAEKKSILLCCATDAEVNYMTKALEPFFTDEEYAHHFLAYTNESHDSPATILRKKTHMEGSNLGQKEHGVVLIAAGFGRGDNVGVETVMLGSVHDENDLGQKGGRTARNGTEGEVLQYYIVKEIDQELGSLRQILVANEDLYKQVMKELTTDAHHPMHTMADFFNPNLKSGLNTIPAETKSNMLLRLREFIAAQDNYPSLVYHEAKAMISSEGIRLIGIADVEQKEDLIKGFATFLNDLEKEWMKIQTAHVDIDDRIDALYGFVTRNTEAHHRLGYLFKDVGEIRCHFKQPEKPQFLLDRALPKLSAQESLMAEAYRLILKLDGLSESMDEWNQMAKYLSSLNSIQLTALLSIYRNSTVISFDGFLDQLVALADKNKKFVEDLEELTDGKQDLLDVTLSSEVQNALIGMPTDVSNLARSYLVAQGLDDVDERVAKATPLIHFSVGNKSGLSYWEHSARDALISLPSGCLTGKPIVSLDASIILGLKKFLDTFVGSQDEKTYVLLFRQFLQSMEHQPEQRKRFLSDYEAILNKAKQPKQVLANLAQLAATLKAPEHFVILKTLIEKMSAEYKKPRVSIEELDRIWEDLLKAGPQLLKFLPLIETHLATEGKEYVSMLHIISQLEPKLITASQEFLKVLYSLSSAEATKRDKVRAYEYIVHQMQESFVGQNSVLLDRIFELFSDFLTSTEFLGFEDKKSLFEGMRELSSCDPNVIKELLLKYREMPKLLSLVYLFKYIPRKHAANLLELQVIIKHFSPTDEFINEEISGISALLEAIPSKISLNELGEILQAFDDKEAMTDLLYLCSHLPEHAANLSALEIIVRHFSPVDEFKEVSIAGIRALLNAIPSKISLNDLENKLQAFDNKGTMTKLLYLCEHFPEHAENLLAFEVISDYFLPNNELKNVEIAGIKNLLKAIPSKISFNELENKLKAFDDKKDVAYLLYLCNRFPEHATDLLSFKDVVSSLHSDYYQNELEEGQKQAYLAGFKVLLDKQLIKADANLPVRLSFISDKQKEKLFLFFKSFPSYVSKISDTDFLPWANYLCSLEYEELPSEVQEITFPAVQNLLKKGKTIFADAKGVAQFAAPKEMTQLLLLAEQYPAQADKLLALKPLIAVIAKMDDPSAQEVARRAVGNFLENQNRFKTPFDSIKAHIAALTPQALERLLNYWQLLPDHAVSIMQNNLAQITADGMTTEQLAIVEEFYKQEDKNTWIRNNIMKKKPLERVALMTFLRHGDFIIKKPDNRGPKFTEQTNKKLFEAGLDCYQQHINKLLQKQQKKAHRGLSILQQQQIKDIMAEFSSIGKARDAITAAVSVKTNLKSSIQAQVAVYEKTWIKNSERYQSIQHRIQGLSQSAGLNTYNDTLAEIRRIKQELMQKDVQIAAKQFLPRLHFWGQSRLYRTLNNIEDLVVKSWMEDARQQIESADKFAESYQTTCDMYVDKFKDALAIWGQEQRSIFKLPASNILNNIQGKDNEEIVRYLKDNPKVMNALPGTLKAIAKEVLTHDSYTPPSGKEKGL
ncbi:hypothetical protein [Legionella sp.]|uniref:hypothetical protein n=1 Tax=Legionella sp. TaxID=459 RepID=UPI003C8A3A2F